MKFGSDGERVALNHLSALESPLYIATMLQRVYSQMQLAVPLTKLTGLVERRVLCLAFDGRSSAQGRVFLRFSTFFGLASEGGADVLRRKVTDAKTSGRVDVRWRKEQEPGGRSCNFFCERARLGTRKRQARPAAPACPTLPSRMQRPHVTGTCMAY